MVQTRTRSGRQIKKPELYQPEEAILEDDYAPEDHDSDLGSDIDTEDEYYSDDESDDDDDGDGVTEEEGDCDDGNADDLDPPLPLLSIPSLALLPSGTRNEE